MQEISFCVRLKDDDWLPKDTFVILGKKRKWHTFVIIGDFNLRGSLEYLPKAKYH